MPRCFDLNSKRRFDRDPKGLKKELAARLKSCPVTKQVQDCAMVRVSAACEAPCFLRSFRHSTAVFSSMLPPESSTFNSSLLDGSGLLSAVGGRFSGFLRTG